MENIVNEMKGCIETLQKEMKEQVREIENDYHSKIRSLRSAMQSVCEHPKDKLKNDSWDHPHNGDEVEDYSCQLCGRSLSRSEYVKLMEK